MYPLATCLAHDFPLSVYRYVSVLRSATFDFECQPNRIRLFAFCKFLNLNSMQNQSKRKKKIGFFPFRSSIKFRFFSLFSSWPKTKKKIDFTKLEKGCFLKA